MSTSRESCHRWAKQLLAAEASVPAENHPTVHEAARVCEKLRVSLTRFVGPDGFAALMRRSLALARTQTPLLNGLETTADGRLEHMEELVASGEEGILAATAVNAQLLELLVAFVGESLTIRLVREVWPEAQLETDHED
ncbi:MAG TPA: hypothetical protein VFS39_16930 [Nitrospira sp.]|jgi:hypothetical protein|nr:hypothetical protein [Nitrospira sp.]